MRPVEREMMKGLRAAIEENNVPAFRKIVQAIGDIAINDFCKGQQMAEQVLGLKLGQAERDMGDQGEIIERLKKVLIGLLIVSSKQNRRDAIDTIREI